MKYFYIIALISSVSSICFCPRVSINEYKDNYERALCEDHEASLKCNVANSKIINNAPHNVIQAYALAIIFVIMGLIY